MSAPDRSDGSVLRVLTDEAGRERTMRLLAVLRFERDDYALLAETQESDASDASDELDVVVFRYSNNGDGERFAEIEDEDTYDRVVAHCERWLDPTGDAHAHLLERASSAWREGKTTEAREALAVAEGLRTPRSERRTVARLALLRGFVELRRGSLREAQRAFVRALREAKTAGDAGIELEARAGVVETLARRGLAVAARAALGRARERAKRARVELHDRGALDYAEGCVELHDRGAREALDGFTRAGTKREGEERALVAHLVESAARADAANAGASDHFATMGDCAKTLLTRGYARGSIDAVLLHGATFYAHGFTAEAGGAFVAAGERALAIGDAWGEATALRWQAWCHLRLASPQRAAELFLEAHRRARAIDDYGAMARCAMGLACVLVKNGEPGEALALTRPALAWLRSVGDGRGRVELYRARADAWRLLGREAHARRAEKKAARLLALAGTTPSRLAAPEVWIALS